MGPLHFYRNAPNGEGRALFETVAAGSSYLELFLKDMDPPVMLLDPKTTDGWEYDSFIGAGDGGVMHVFRCLHCGTLKGWGEIT